MAKVNMTTPLGVSAEQVWEVIGKFNALSDWHPAVEKCELEEGGSIRRLSLAGGGEIVEKLEQSDSDEKTYSYSIVSSPLPVANYSSELKVVENDGKCEVQWSSNFDPSGAAEGDAVKAIQGVYQAGFDALQKMFKV